MIRGARPYQLIVDDVRADDGSARNFKWIAQIPSDLSLLSHDASDFILGDASGKRLLIRILQADGSGAQFAGSQGSAYAYLRNDAAVVHGGQNQRFVIERVATASPNFKVLLYIHNAGDPLPSTAWSDATPDAVRGADDTLSVVFPGQADTITFAPRAIAVQGGQPGGSPAATELLVARSGSGTLADTRGTVEPAPIVRSSGSFSPAVAPANLTGTASGNAVALAWSAVPGGERYRVKRSGTAGGPYTLVGTAYWNNFTDTGVPNPAAHFYIVTALDAAGNESAPSAEVAVSTLSLPRGWSSADIGAPALAGSAAYLGANGFGLLASGTDIFNVADQFHFAYVPWIGSGTLVARVVSLTPTDPWAKAGVMFRDSLDPGAINACMVLSATSGVAFQRRLVTGTTSASTTAGGFYGPYWVKLERVGSSFKAYRSPDGTAWTQVGSTTTVAMSGSMIYAGLAVTSHKATALASARFDNVQFIGAPVPPSGLAATPLSESQLQLAWTNPAFNDAAGAVEVSPVGAGAWSSLTGSLPAASTGFVAANLAASGTYDFRVKLTNATGASPWATLTAATPAGIGDGIPGWWRHLYFGDGLAVIPGVSGPDDDPDADGATNRQEQLAGTAPADPSSTFRITGLSRSGNDITVAFSTVAGRLYKIERSANLSGGPWVTVFDDVPGTGGTVQRTDAGAGVQPQLYYRAQAKP
jgi:hypothetical protein